MIQEAYIQGAIDPLGRATWCGHGHVGRLQEPGLQACGEIDDKVNGFLDRSLEGDWPGLWLDATL